MRTRPHPLAVALVVAATYVYFLIFAEFAFIELAMAEGLAGAALRGVMGMLAAGGIAGSVLAAWRFRAAWLGGALQIGFVVCGLGAMAAAVVSASGFRWVAIVVGLGLGWLTVTLAAGLRGVLDAKRLGWWIGVGTGLAYAICNLPPVFATTAQNQAWLSVLVCGLGVILARRWQMEKSEPTQGVNFKWRAVSVWVLLLLVLVWLDSAAFYVIQHAADLRTPTWAGDARLWGNAAMHMGAALLAGWVIDRGWMARLLPVAFALLWLACWRLSHGLPGGSVWFYTAAVSLYSTVLVAYPAASGRPWIAAAVYAIAGWVGSALGIGMVQDLHTIPEWFLIAAAVAFGIAWLGQSRTARWLAVFAVLSLVTATGRAQDSALVTRGREVYVAEGCIHCHSQYVRPDTADISRWGPPAPMTETLAAEPPLLGNRRQGPDLANVGLRRSAEWNRLHLISPSAITPGSRMPAYAHLFRGRDSRGEALVAYLATLGANRAEQARVLQDQWHPSAAVPQPREEQARLFAALCVSCHGPAGRGDGPLARQLSAPPPDFTQGWRRLSSDEADFELKLMRLIKFGLPGTPMAGHEYLRDRDVLSLAAYVETLHALSHP